jgi:hypothetical protein
MSKNVSQYLTELAMSARSAAFQKLAGDAHVKAWESSFKGEGGVSWARKPDHYQQQLYSYPTPMGAYRDNAIRGVFLDYADQLGSEREKVQRRRETGTPHEKDVATSMLWNLHRHDSRAEQVGLESGQFRDGLEHRPWHYFWKSPKEWGPVDNPRRSLDEFSKYFWRKTEHDKDNPLETLHRKALLGKSRPVETEQYEKERSNKELEEFQRMRAAKGRRISEILQNEEDYDRYRAAKAVRIDMALREREEGRAAQLSGKNMPSSEPSLKPLSKPWLKANKMQDVAKAVARYAPALLPLILAGAGGAFAGRVYEEDAKPNEDADAKRKRARNRMLMGGGVGALMSAPLVLKAIKRIKNST